MVLDTIKRWFLGAKQPIYSNDISLMGPTSSGINITPEMALTFSAVFACINIIADTIASLPLFVYKKTTRTKTLSKTHSMYNILHNSPNMLYSSYTFRYILIKSLLMTGNAYAMIERSEDNVIQSLRYIAPDKVKITISDAGEKFFIINDKTYGNFDVLHFMILSDSGLIGKGVISYARENIGLGLAAEKFGQKFFDGENINAVIEMPMNIQKDKREQLISSLKQNYGGVNKSSGTLVLSGGAKYINNIIPLDDAQFIQTRKFQLLEIARLFRVPPHKLGELEKSSYSTNEQAEIAYLQDTIRPMLVNIEQEFNRKLWTVAEQNIYQVEFNMSGRLRGDVASRSAYYTNMRTSFNMTADEVRALENMNPLTLKQKKELEYERANITVYANKDDLAANEAKEVPAVVDETVEPMAEKTDTQDDEK